MARELHDSPGAATDEAADVLERDPELEELQRRHRGFVFPAVLFALVFYMALILSAAYAPGFMGRKVAGAITVGYVFALLQFVMTFVLAWLYTRFARQTFDPMASDLLAKLHRSRGNPEVDA